MVSVGLAFVKVTAVPRDLGPPAAIAPYSRGPVFCHEFVTIQPWWEEIGNKRGGPRVEAEPDPWTPRLLPNVLLAG